MKIATIGVCATLLCALGIAHADDLTAALAAQLLAPAMTDDCGSYYTEQGDPAFDDIDSKPMCRYVPRITHLEVDGESAQADFNRDRHFDEAMSQAWLHDYAVMAAKDKPNIIYQALKKNLDRWRTDSAGVDQASRPGHARFTRANGVWTLASVVID